MGFRPEITMGTWTLYRSLASKKEFSREHQLEAEVNL